MARISTHVLDIAKGKPAADVVVDLYFEGSLVRSLTTNLDGRTEEPFLSDAGVRSGHYEFVFHAGDYLRETGHVLEEPQFLDLISIRFGVSDPHGNYHVPLLLAAHGYSTYRGS